MPEILAHPQIARTGVKLDGGAPSVSDPPPLLGQHNAGIYGALGLSAVIRLC